MHSISPAQPLNLPPLPLDHLATLLQLVRERVDCSPDLVLCADVSGESIFETASCCIPHPAEELAGYRLRFHEQMK
jgi:hypothetical protein